MGISNQLKKKYKCEQCGKYFRTLQGLSGHKQFKHGSGITKTSLADAIIETCTKQEIWKAFSSKIDFDPVVMEKIDSALSNWAIISSFLNVVGSHVNDNDFKNFMLLSLSSH